MVKKVDLNKTRMDALPLAEWIVEDPDLSVLCKWNHISARTCNFLSLLIIVLKWCSLWLQRPLVIDAIHPDRCIIYRFPFLHRGSLIFLRLRNIGVALSYNNFLLIHSVANAREPEGHEIIYSPIKQIARQQNGFCKLRSTSWKRYTVRKK